MLKKTMAERTYFFVKLAAIVISLLFIVGNALQVIVRLKNMKTSINYIILNLAILDAISGFLGIFYVFSSDYSGAMGEPLLQQAYNHSVILTDVLCRIEWCYWFTSGISPTLLMAMAYERFKAIVHPFSRLNGAVTKARLKIILVFAWSFGLGYLIFDMVVVGYDEKSGICDESFYSWYSVKAYHFVYIATQYFIPSAAIFNFYLRVIVALRKQDNALAPQAEVERARRKARKKVMWIIIVVTLTFYICCGIPYIMGLFMQLIRIHYLILICYGTLLLSC